MRNPLRPLLKAHVKAYYRNLGGKVVYVPDHNDARPEGRDAGLHERTAMGRHTDGSYYLRATDAEDAKAIQASAQKRGIELEKRRRGATHHGRLGAYDHFHVQDPTHAAQIMGDLGANPEPPKATLPKQPDPRSTQAANRPMHTAESVAKLRDHEDYEGFGYFGHSNHHPDLDAAVAEVANHHGLDTHQVSAFLHGRSGRWAMDELDRHVPEDLARKATALLDKDEDAGSKAWQEAMASIPREKKVEHFKQWMDPKGRNWKHFKVDTYARELREREGTRSSWKTHSPEVDG